jgi:hypothetical protein
MTKQTERMTEEQMVEAMRQEAQRAIPPKRSFIVIRRARTREADGYIYPMPHEGSEEICVEAHSYSAHDSGALVFNTHYFSEKGLSGPGIYTRASLTIAPGTWLDVRETSEEMQLRPSSIS